MVDMIVAPGGPVALTRRDFAIAGGMGVQYIFFNRARRIADGVLTWWRSEGDSPDVAMQYHPDRPNPALYTDFVVVERLIRG